MITLRALRQSVKLTQGQFGERIRVNQKRLANWEQGRERVPQAYRAVIAATFARTDIDWDIDYVGRSASARHVQYRVRGMTGEQDDAMSWLVEGTYPTIEPAHAQAAQLNAWCLAQRFHRTSYPLPSWASRDAASAQTAVNGPLKRSTCPLDPLFVCDYTGTIYDVVPVLIMVMAKVRGRPKVLSARPL